MWHMGRVAGFDLETSSLDVEAAFIVSGSVATIDASKRRLNPHVQKWVLSPGDRDIDPESAAIHGYTTERARAEGEDHQLGVDNIAAAVTAVLKYGQPIIGHNVAFDLTILDRECAREGVPTVTERIGDGPRPIIDSMLLDKHCLPGRARVSPTQGAYQLQTTARAYGLSWDPAEAHHAEYDAVMSARAALRIAGYAHLSPVERPTWIREWPGEQFSDVAFRTLFELHDMQVKWAATDAAVRQRWLRTSAPEEIRDPDAVVDGTWPLRRRPVAAS